VSNATDMERARECVELLEGSGCKHSAEWTDEGLRPMHRQISCSVCIAQEIAAALAAERERCCHDACQHCAAGSKPKVLRDYGGQMMHLFQGSPPRVCSAAAIRARGGA
jgi:hypothetical protein